MSTADWKLEKGVVSLLFSLFQIERVHVCTDRKSERLRGKDRDGQTSETERWTDRRDRKVNRMRNRQIEDTVLSL